ncbi:MAG TPA: class I SAM-dependent methyltransferase [Rhodothermales bacterium]|nr:class I SAM-dependent methyltransferase [Rhodothermales bacterium]
MTAPVGTEVYQSSNHHKYQTRSRVYQWHLQEFMECLYDLIAQTNPRSVLDAGCGEGHTVKYLAERNPDLKLTGVDVSEGAVGFAQEQLGDRARFRAGSVYKLPFSDRSFDTVVCSEVLEHLDEPERAVAELKRVARNAVVITVPREPYFQWLNNVGQWLGVSPDPGHVNFWNKEEFQRFVAGHFEDPAFAWKHTYQLALAYV